MARKDQPYLPLYVQDFVTDEKLMECSAEATGVYIRLMCLLHKSEQYGTILLKQKYKQGDKQDENFASQIAKSLPYDLPTISRAVKELLAEGVIKIEGDFLIQKRMVKDAEISHKRASAGSKGGQKTQSKIPDFDKANAKAKIKANTENEIEIENTNENEFVLGEKGGVGEREEPLRENPNQRFVVPEMLAVFTKKNPAYVAQNEKDFPALKKIAEFIASQERVDAFTPAGLDKVKSTWSLLVDFIASDKFYSGYQLSQIEKYFQAIVKKFADGLSGVNEEIPTRTQQGSRSTIHNNMDAAAEALAILNRKRENQSA